jgi:hypothetical protein
MEELNKFLTKVMGECWHTHPLVIEGIWGIKCDKCGIIVTPNLNNDFLTWEGFGKLWTWSNNELWWCRFLDSLDGPLSYYVNPENFTKAVVQYLAEKYNT